MLETRVEHKLFLNDREFKGSSTINLWNGTATLNVYPDDKIKIGDTLNFKSEINDVSRIENNNFWVMGEYHLKREVGDADGVFIIIFKNINGEWKIVADMSC